MTTQTRGNYDVHAAGYADADDDIHDAYDGETPQVAVEVFDHPLAEATYHPVADRELIDRGVWYVGEEKAVMAALKYDGLEDWVVQYELRQSKA